MKKRRRKKRKFTRHHLTNRVNGGDKRPENMLKLVEEKHHLIHILFGNLDLYQIVILLIRVARAKHYEKVNPKIRELYYINEDTKPKRRKNVPS